jgi:thioredoxin reductase
LKKANVQIIEEHKVVKILPMSIVIENNLNQQSELEVDHVVFSMGTESYNPLEELYRNYFDNVFVIGDAINPGSITNAIKDGFEKSYVLESIVISKNKAKDMAGAV